MDDLFDAYEQLIDAGLDPEDFMDSLIDGLTVDEILEIQAISDDYYGDS